MEWLDLIQKIRAAFKRALLVLSAISNFTTNLLIHNRILFWTMVWTLSLITTSRVNSHTEINRFIKIMLVSKVNISSSLRSPTLQSISQDLITWWWHHCLILGYMQESLLFNFSLNWMMTNQLLKIELSLLDKLTLLMPAQPLLFKRKPHYRLNLWLEQLLNNQHLHCQNLFGIGWR